LGARSLPQRYKGGDQVLMVQACEGLAEAHAATDQLSKGLTLEFSGARSASAGMNS
jgi:hypothetical protein